MKKHSVILFVILLATSCFFFSCNNIVNQHTGNFIFDSIQVNQKAHLFGDTTKPACNITVNFTYATKASDEQMKDSVNKYFLSMSFGDKYMEMLQYATQLWGKTGDVRTAFIVGLEPAESLLEGVEEICRIGVAPILSVFRPIPGTDGENLTPPSNELLLDIYQKAESICEKYNLRLGPTCVPCQNNTLSMPLNLL